MDRIAFWQVQYNTALSLCVFMVWVKVFKFMSFNKTMLQLSTTLSRVSSSILEKLPFLVKNSVKSRPKAPSNFIVFNLKIC